MRSRTLINRKAAAPRPCVVCGEPFIPRRWAEQRTCGSVRCVRVLGARKHQGRLPPAFAADAQRRREARRAAVQATCRRQWGELSVREIEIFQFAMREGYDRGYSKGRTWERRAQKSTAA